MKRFSNVSLFKMAVNYNNLELLGNFKSLIFLIEPLVIEISVWTHYLMNKEQFSYSKYVLSRLLVFYCKYSFRLQF